MKAGLKTSFCLGICIAASLSIATGAYGSPSGLNNIPTADTCAKQTMVFQTWEELSGGSHDAKNWVGVKYGLFENAEIGADYQTMGDPIRYPQFQAKYTIDILEEIPRIAAGIANVSTDRARNGEPMPYAVATYDVLHICRLHAGYSIERNNEGGFGGIDRTFRLGNIDVMVCGDVIQCDDRDDALLAPGIKISPAAEAFPGTWGMILNHLALETWTTFPTSGDAETYVVKLNAIVRF